MENQEPHWSWGISKGSATGAQISHLQLVTPFCFLAGFKLFLVCSQLFIFFFWFLWQWHVGSQFPDQESNLQPLHWQHRVLTTGPPGKSLRASVLWLTSIYFTMASLTASSQWLTHSSMDNDNRHYVTYFKSQNRYSDCQQKGEKHCSGQSIGCVTQIAFKKKRDFSPSHCKCCWETAPSLQAPQRHTDCLS